MKGRILDDSLHAAVNVQGRLRAYQLKRWNSKNLLFTVNPTQTTLTASYLGHVQRDETAPVKSEPPLMKIRIGREWNQSKSRWPNFHHKLLYIHLDFTEVTRWCWWHGKFTEIIFAGADLDIIASGCARQSLTMGGTEKWYAVCVWVWVCARVCSLWTINSFITSCNSEGECSQGRELISRRRGEKCDGEGRDRKVRDECVCAAVTRKILRLFCKSHNRLTP